MKVLSDEIIALLSQKNKAAYEVVFHMYYPRLVYFAREYISLEEAKNMVQDAFLILWSNHQQFTNEAQLQGFLYTCVKNNCLMRLRHEEVKRNYCENEKIRKQKQIHQLALEQLDTSTAVFQEIEKIIEETLLDLPPRCREIFILSRIEGKKNKEIADSLDLSVKAVEAQITVALKKFRIALKDFLPLIAFFLFQ